MSILIIGGDKVDRIEKMVKSMGAKKTAHWDSQRNLTSHKQIPSDTDGIIMLTDFLKHNSMVHFKKEANKQKIPFVCVCRGTGQVAGAFLKLSTMCQIYMDNKTMEGAEDV